MKCRSVVILTVLLFNLSIHDKAQSQELTWEFTKTTRDSHGQEKNENITYFVSPEVTKINHSDEIIYIDYRIHILYRYNKADEVCLKFPLISNNINQPANTKELLKKRNISLISNLKVVSTTDHKEIAQYNCSLKHVMYGADLAMFQMVAPPVVHEFGQRFTESMVGYYVSDKVIGLHTLYNIAQKRSDIFKNNPLLRQIDIVGLLELLNGFPVQMIQKHRDTDSVTTLLGNPKPNKDNKLFFLPAECR